MESEKYNELPEFSIENISGQEIVGLMYSIRVILLSPTVRMSTTCPISLRPEESSQKMPIYFLTQA
jgi:hypothetical protein